MKKLLLLFSLVPVLCQAQQNAYYGSFTGTLVGTTNTGILGIPTNTFLHTSVNGWGATNTIRQLEFVTLTFDLTPTAALQGCIDAYWTNSAGVMSNSAATGVGVVAQSVTLSGFLESNGVVSIKTNRLNGATVVIAVRNSQAIPIP